MAIHCFGVSNNYHIQRTALKDFFFWRGRSQYLLIDIITLFWVELERSAVGANALDRVDGNDFQKMPNDHFGHGCVVGTARKPEHWIEANFHRRPLP
jgi:hypothetical protein